MFNRKRRLPTNVELCESFASKKRCMQNQSENLDSGYTDTEAPKHHIETTEPIDQQHSESLRYDIYKKLLSIRNTPLWNSFCYDKTITINPIVNAAYWVIHTITAYKTRKLQLPKSNALRVEYDKCSYCFNNGEREFRFIENHEGDTVCLNCARTTCSSKLEHAFDEIRNSNHISETHEREEKVRRALKILCADTYLLPPYKVIIAHKVIDSLGLALKWHTPSENGKEIQCSSHHRTIAIAIILVVMTHPSDFVEQLHFT